MAPTKTSRKDHDEHKADAPVKEKNGGHGSTKMRRGASQQTHAANRDPHPAPASVPVQVPAEALLPSVRRLLPRWLLSPPLQSLLTQQSTASRSDTNTTLTASLGLLRATIPPRLPPRARADHAVVLLEFLPQLGALATRQLGPILSHNGPQAADQATVQRPARPGRAQALQWAGHPGERCHCRLHIQSTQSPGRKRPRHGQASHCRR